MKWIALLANVALGVLSSVFIKMSIIPPEAPPHFADSTRFSDGKLFWLGFFFYAISFFTYIMVVAHFSVRIAQTVVTSAIIIIATCLSSLIWDEPFYWTTAIGIMFVMIGITLISFHTI
ncbi:EamA family transporter [Candidatus Liberibacter asiaticus]|uniref:Transmembrane protein n=3 Tax=Liberibacter asiaticus TaxID=34021 RepID=A0ABN4AZR1_LIBAS|nr:EamA family transporter [Candidatus Liberibacter asiaticus]ACT56771.1 putative transmembrane protein [Candidatus Liberibacter asiaticus str. psy62]AGH16538.1 putative transmembrane protein [Candidatus Liberibacter asiaticus str. gxpsy]ALK06936.1 EamA family transporter [Candidatus Liberibacter asiaticus]ASK52407.1 hypothetical protein B2I23_00870 [Candidatus Liberibacter asiaticus]AWL13732.1 hypothetical protein DIC79_00880 [Candidatus Liberibacter asiaticus]